MDIYPGYYLCNTSFSKFIAKWLLFLSSITTALKHKNLKKKKPERDLFRDANNGKELLRLMNSYPIVEWLGNLHKPTRESL